MKFGYGLGVQVVYDFELKAFRACSLRIGVWGLRCAEVYVWGSGLRSRVSNEHGFFVLVA